jgi:HEAT repeat protein
MTLISQPGHWQQMALASLDAGLALDITVMLDDVHAVLDGLAAGEAPAAARQAAAILDDTDSPYTLAGLAAAVSETRGMLARAAGNALAGVPDHIPGT